MKRYVFIFLSILSLLFSSTIEQAEGYYKSQEYEKALSSFLSVYETYPNSAELNYNIGNTYYKLGELGKSIFYYKKSLSLTPRDRDVETNLSLARKQVVGLSNDGNESDLFSFLSVVTGRQLLFFIVGIAILLNILLAYFFVKKRSEMLKNIIYLVSVFLILISGLLVLKETREQSYRECVVIVKKTSVKSGPSNSFKELFFLHEGYEFKELLQQEEWSKIRLQNGAIGWISTSDFWRL